MLTNIAYKLGCATAHVEHRTTLPASKLVDAFRMGRADTHGVYEVRAANRQQLHKQFDDFLEQRTA